MLQTLSTNEKLRLIGFASSLNLDESLFVRSTEYYLNREDPATIGLTYGEELVRCYLDLGLRLNGVVEGDLLSKGPGYKDHLAQLGVVMASSYLYKLIVDRNPLALNAVFSGNWAKYLISDRKYIPDVKDFTSPTPYDFVDVLANSEMALQFHGNQVISDLIKSMVLGGSENYPIRFAKSLYKHSSSCSTTELHFKNMLEVPSNRHISIFVDRNGEPVLLEKTQHHYENRLAISLLPVVVNGVLLPAGSILELNYPGFSVYKNDGSSNLKNMVCSIRLIDSITGVYPLKLSLHGINNAEVDIVQENGLDHALVSSVPKVHELRNYAVGILNGGIFPPEIRYFPNSDIS